MSAPEPFTLAILCQEDVVIARRQARSIAVELGFDVFATAAVTTATSELARNVFVHGGGGRVIMSVIKQGQRVGIELAFHDDGPGIEQVERALAGGWSTKRSLGLGLSGSKRLVDEFDLTSSPGKGTHIRVVKWKRR